MLAITGMLGILYIPSQIIVSGDVDATVMNIKSNEWLYRLGIVNQLICQALFVYLVVVLYRLFNSVSTHYAKQMVALVIASVPIAFVNMLNQIAALILLSEADFLKAFDPGQLNALVMVFFKLYEQGIIVAQVFWGLWLIPFGLLAYHSMFIPKYFGIMLVIGGIGYVIASFVELQFPSYASAINPIATIPSAIGEFGIIIYFFIKGVREPKPVIATT